MSKGTAMELKSGHTGYRYSALSTVLVSTLSSNSIFAHLSWLPKFDMHRKHRWRAEGRADHALNRGISPWVECSSQPDPGHLWRFPISGQPHPCRCATTTHPLYCETSRNSASLDELAEKKKKKNNFWTLSPWFLSGIRVLYSILSCSWVS